MCDCQPITENFRIPALHCSGEMARIRCALDGLAGIAELIPDYDSHTLRVDYCPHRLDSPAIASAIIKAGFQIASPYETAEPAICDTCDVCSGYETVKPRWRVTTTVGGVLLLMAFAAWAVAGAEITPVAAILLVTSTLACGIPVVRTAWRSLRRFAFDMNVLMSMAAVGAVAIGEYFEAAAAMFLFSVSLWLEAVSMYRARRAVQSLVELTPAFAHRLENAAAAAATTPGGNATAPVFDTSKLRDVYPNELALGDVILLRPGERAPTDGMILSGTSSLNEAAITGESLPVEKETGQAVFAGSLNGEGALWIRATHTAESSTLARIARLVSQAQAARSPTERFVDRFAARYTPLVIVLAVLLAFAPPLLNYLGWSFAGSVPASEWFRRALVLLVIACPCALVISTPVTVVCGLYSAARRGILVKGGQFLETAGLLRAIAFDKTGTLTRGRPEVVGVEPAEGRSADDVLSIAASLELHSEHPLARASVEAAKIRGITPPATNDFAALRGFGVRGKLGGETFFVGSPRMFDAEDFAGVDFGNARTLQPDNASTVALVATTDSFWGVIRLTDPPRADAAHCVAELKSLGLESLSMLSGDGESAVRQIARQVGVDRCYANLLPEEKVERVRAIAAETAPLAMVGDGVNDAPALAASDLGIALGVGASDTALETADVAIMTDDLGRIAELIRLGRRCRSIMGQNIALALSIKAIVLAAAAAGAATLWMAVVADVGASMIVIANGMRLAGTYKK